MAVYKLSNSGIRTRRSYSSFSAGNEAPVPPLYGNSVVSSGLILHLDAANTSSYSGSGSTWTDLTGNNNATLISSPTYETLNTRGFLTFNGTSQYGTIPFSNSPFRQTSAITYDVWVKVATAGGGYVAGTSSSGGQGTGGLGIYTDSALFTWTPSNPQSDRSFTNSSPVSFENTWKHVCMTFNYSTNTKALYINGSSVSMTDSGSWTTATPAGSSYNLSQADSIAGRFVNSQGYFKGSIAAIKIYNTALSSSDVTTNFNALKQRFGL
jgi:hypothetical protein